MSGSRHRAPSRLSRSHLIPVLAVVGVVALVTTAALTAPGDQVGDVVLPAPGGETPATEQPDVPADTLTVTAVGDTIMGVLPDALPPGDGVDYFADVAPALTGDVVFGNLEGALSTRTDFKKCAPKDKCFYIRMPPEYAPLLAEAGFTVMNGANNHAYDSGPDGHADTDAALRDVGIEYAGVKGRIVELDVDGTTVAVVGFATYDYYDNLLDLETVAAVVAAAEQRADLVLVSMRVGAEGTDARHVPGEAEEFGGEPRGDSTAVAHTAVDNGADLVIGHGPHVLRGMEFYQGRLVMHSLGNFAGYGVLATDGALGRGAVVSVELAPDGSWVSGTATATRMIGGGAPSLDADNGAYADFNELAADFGAAGVTVTDAGELTVPR